MNKIPTARCVNLCRLIRRLTVDEEYKAYRDVDRLVGICVTAAAA